MNEPLFRKDFEEIEQKKQQLFIYNYKVRNPAKNKLIDLITF